MRWDFCLWLLEWHFLLIPIWKFVNALSLLFLGKLEGIREGTDDTEILFSEIVKKWRQKGEDNKNVTGSHAWYDKSEECFIRRSVDGVDG